MVSSVTTGASTISVIASERDMRAITANTPRMYANPQMISGNTHATMPAMRSVSLMVRDRLWPALVTL